MRRPARGQQQDSSSLFPFLAVLLCTMGALVVLLVAMAHVSRDKAARETAAAQAAQEREADRPDPAAQQRIAQARAYQEQAAQAREEALQRLRDEQARLAGVEDHLRRLNDETETLRAEALELIALEQEHNDDREAAEQELARRKANIESLRAELDEQKQEAANQTRRYAIVPMRDVSTGNARPPIYFECGADGIVLQPEGIRFTAEDLRFGDVSSPLLAADRAVRSYYQENPELLGSGSSGPPYPLFVIRPDGVEALSRAVVTFENVNADYGSQPVAEDWAIEFGQPNPELAQRVAMAIEQSRLDRQRLAAAAPQLFRSKQQRMIAASRSDPSPDYTKPGVDGSDAWNPFDSLNEHAQRQARSQGHSEASPSEPHHARATPTNGGGGGSGGSEGGAESLAGVTKTSDGPTEGVLGGTESQGSTTPNNSSTPGGKASPLITASKGMTKQHGAGRARKGAPKPDGIPIRRTVNLVVSNDRITILPDRETSAPTTGATIEMIGPTSRHLGEFAIALQQHARAWGLAGPDMYWKPTVRLNVTSNGGRRAEEIAEQLEAAGLKVQTTAQTVGDSRGADAPLKR